MMKSRSIKLGVAVLSIVILISTVSSARADVVGVFGGNNPHRNSLAADLTSLGHSVTDSFTLAGLGSLSQYDTIWNVIGTWTLPFSASEQSLLAAYVTSGGGLHLSGDMGHADSQHAAVSQLLNTIVLAGGLTVGFQGNFLGPYYSFNSSAKGGITSNPNVLGSWYNPYGFGGIAGLAAPENVLVSGADGTTVGAVWDQADLGGAGRVTLLMEVAWVLFGGSRIQIIQNIQTFLSNATLPSLPPTAVAGSDQSIIAGDTVFLDGSASFDDNTPTAQLLFSWSFSSLPAGSLAEIVDPTAEQTSFVADVAGTYIVSLVVNDGSVDSNPDTVTIAAIPPDEAAAEILFEMEVMILLIPPEDLHNDNAANPLINKIEAALTMIAEGSYQEALDKLQNDILQKTDGCAETGQPDKNDWLLMCEDQVDVHTLVTRAIVLLQRLI